MYYSLPFSFDKILAKEKPLNTASLLESIRGNVRFLIFSRLGDFAYDRKLGFEIWDRDKEVFYREKKIYYEELSAKDFKGTMEHNEASKHFTNNLRQLIIENEPRIEKVKASFTFTRLPGPEGAKADYQRRIVIEVGGRIKSTGHRIDPSIQVTMLYSPFKVEIK